ncbi:MAG TPA: SPOR domain-containing protein [Novosphingobium sp.]|nr:SPOR domain-containing protein [Novosphingobium sp.]
MPKNGPAADYPIVVGAPYVVNGTNFTPVDTMNYDAVGRASVSPEGGSAVSGAHHTLPLPSYVEVTALDSGRTILVRVERRGPMNGTQLIELSPGAAAQLGMVGTVQAAVRVRRVNPVEPERALLRAGQSAPARMDTPKSLLIVLQRKLDAQEGVVRAPVQADPEPATTPKVDQPTQAKPAAPAKPKPEPKKPAPKKPEVKKPEAKPAEAPKPAVQAPAEPKPGAKQPQSAGRFLVQVGAYSSKANADAAARKSGGSANQSGKLWSVRMGPFASEADAKAALARARAAGYSDARILRSN